MENFEVLYCFSKGKQSIVEVKRLDIESEDKSEIYFWLKIDTQNFEIEVLDFKAQSSKNGIQFRTFSQGKLEFDEKGAVYEKLKLRSGTVKSEEKALIGLFLKSLEEPED